MKTAISLPDDLFARADALARREKKSRSQLYAEALTALLTRREDQAITAALDRVELACQDDESAAWSAAGAATLAGSEWQP